MPMRTPWVTRVEVATASRAFRLVRYVQRKAQQTPGAIAKARDDIASAWAESGANLPKKA